MSLLIFLQYAYAHHANKQKQNNNMMDSLPHNEVVIYFAFDFQDESINNNFLFLLRRFIENWYGRNFVFGGRCIVHRS